jgi:tetratricopeptide (TPR) repeat protein
VTSTKISIGYNGWGTQPPIAKPALMPSRTLHLHAIAAIITMALTVPSQASTTRVQTIPTKATKSSARKQPLTPAHQTYEHKMEMGYLLYFNGDVDRATKAFMSACKLNTSKFEPHLHLISCYLHKQTPKNLSLAADECREVLKRKPGQADVHLILSNILRTQAAHETIAIERTKKFAEAIKQAEDAQRLGADEAKCQNQIAVILLQMGLSEQALKHVDRAISKRNKFPDAHWIRALLLYKQLIAVPAGQDPSSMLSTLNSPEKKHQIDEIMQELDTAIAQNNGVNAEAFNTKGDILFALQQFTVALPAYQTAVEQDPKYANAWSGLSNCYLQLAGCETETGKKNNYLANARTASTRLKELKPSDSLAIFQNAMMLARVGLIKEAIQELHNALQLESDPSVRHQIESELQELKLRSGFGELDAPVGDFDLDLIKTIKPPVTIN